MANASAQICQRDETPTVVQSSNFTNNGVTVTDQRSGLMWQTCPVGYTLSSGQCVYDVNTSKLYTWKDALALANTATTGGYNDWRLPNVKELLSIIDYQCMGPAFNLTVFPNTPSSEDRGFWTSTPLHTLPDNVSSDRATVIYAESATGSLQYKSILVGSVPTMNFVRLVRDTP
jgi:hypothetical protein